MTVFKRQWKSRLPGEVVKEWMFIYGVTPQELEARCAEYGYMTDWEEKCETDAFCFDDCMVLADVFKNSVRYWLDVCCDYWMELKEDYK